MAENIQRSSGRPQQYKFDRAGTIAEMGPYIGIITNNIDNTRSGRLQVWIAEFGATNADGSPDLLDTSLWRTVNYIPPFYGITPRYATATGTDTGPGTYPTNQQSYGMWFTPPDIGSKVICFFVAGDPAQGYYMGCVPEIGLNHMIPAIGAVANYATDNKAQEAYFADALALPVTELNSDNQNISDNPRFFDSVKPVHSVQAAVLFQQGLATDIERGPISSSAQRESPSTVYGISTPGQPIYNSGVDPRIIRQQLATGKLTTDDVKVIGRQGGHTFVMDDGNLDGDNALVRLRSAKGHQITMNDSGDFFYIVHANGQTWIELGSEGTVDIFSTNSVNVRTQGDINLHADRDINMFAGRNINMKSNAAVNIGAVTTMNLAAEDNLTIYSSAVVGVRADGSLALKSNSGSWNSAGGLSLKGSRIDLNGGAAADVPVPKLFPKRVMDDVTFDYSTGWKTKPNGLESIVSRAPTHEPYSYHNEGVDVKVALAAGQPTPPPTAEPVPSGWTLQAQP